MQCAALQMPLHLLNQPVILLSGLFHRVILMSGSLFAPWARVRDPREYALQLARAFNCTEASEGENDEKKNPSAARRRDPIEHCLRYRQG